MSIIMRKNSEVHKSLRFLLNHPRRSYTFLFPSQPTWILFVVIFTLNVVDILLIIVLDLDKPEVDVLPGGPQVVAALFQAVSSSTLELLLQPV